MRVKAVPNQVVSFKLADDCYTLGQMRENSLIQFFDVQSPDGNWGALDLNDYEPIFCIFVAENRMSSIIDGVADAVIPNI